MDKCPEQPSIGIARRSFSRLIHFKTGHAHTGEYYKRFVPSEEQGWAQLPTRQNILFGCPLHPMHQHLLGNRNRHGSNTLRTINSGQRNWSCNLLKRPSTKITTVQTTTRIGDSGSHITRTENDYGVHKEPMDPISLDSQTITPRRTPPEDFTPDTSSVKMY